MKENIYSTSDTAVSFKVPYSTEVKIQTRHYPYETWMLDIPTDITPLESANLVKFHMWAMGSREPEHFSSMFIKKHNIERLFKEVK